MNKILIFKAKLIVCMMISLMVLQSMAQSSDYKFTQFPVYESGQQFVPLKYAGQVNSNYYFVCGKYESSLKIIYSTSYKAEHGELYLLEYSDQFIPTGRTLKIGNRNVEILKILQEEGAAIALLRQSEDEKERFVVKTIDLDDFSISSDTEVLTFSSAHAGFYKFYEFEQQQYYITWLKKGDHNSIFKITKLNSAFDVLNVDSLNFPKTFNDPIFSGKELYILFGDMKKNNIVYFNNSKGDWQSLELELEGNSPINFFPIINGDSLRVIGFCGEGRGKPIMFFSIKISLNNLEPTNFRLNDFYEVYPGVLGGISIYSSGNGDNLLISNFGSHVRSVILSKLSSAGDLEWITPIRGSNRYSNFFNAYDHYSAMHYEGDMGYYSVHRRDNFHLLFYNGNKEELDPSNEEFDKLGKISKNETISMLLVSETGKLERTILADFTDSPSFLLWEKMTFTLEDGSILLFTTDTKSLLKQRFMKLKF